MKNSTPSEADPQDQNICRKCGKRIVADDRGGSLTSYLFQPFNCSCAISAAAPGTDQTVSTRTKGSNLCPDCGLKMADGKKLGSLTGFLFQDTRCKCPAKNPAVDGEMAKRFWQLKQAGLGDTFSSSATSAKKTTQTTIDLLPGAVIGGTYKIIRLIGTGGMGEVYLARHLTLEKNCALKLIPPDQVTDISWQRFQAEAKSIAKLNHINLVKVSDLGIHEGCLPFLAMEYIDGQTLAEMIEKNGPMTLTEVMPVFMQLCDGVDYAHRNGIVHRDLKPANIMLVRSTGGKLSVKILDFGLVKLTQSDQHKQSLTAVGDVFGSPFYMSPEQCLGGKIDNRSDIYSIGCTLFESLTGRPPFVGSSPVEIVTSHQTADAPTLESAAGRNAFPESMEIVVAKLLRKNPVERYQTLLELRGDLEKVSRGEKVEPFYISRAQRKPGANNDHQPGGKSDYRSEDSVSKTAQGRRTVLISGIIVSLVAAAVVISCVTNAGLVPSLYREVQPTTSSPSGTAYFSTLVEESGVRYRRFHFPDDVPIGSIRSIQFRSVAAPPGKTMYSATDMVHGKSILALGTVQFLAAEQLSFFPATVINPSNLTRFRPGEIFDVCMKDISNKSLGEYLEVCSHIPGLARLDLRDNPNAQQESIALIDNYESLKYLNLTVKNGMVPALAKLSTLKKLKGIAFYGKADLDPILESLRNSPNMAALKIQNGRISREGLASIGTLSQLENLVIFSDIFNDQSSINDGLTLFSKLPHLKVLELESELKDKSIQINADTNRIIQTFKPMQMLRLGRGNFLTPQGRSDTQYMMHKDQLIDHLTEVDDASQKLRAAPASLKDTAPFSTPVQENGRPVRLFNFPQDVTIGTVTYGGSRHYPATGKIIVPAVSTVWFTPDFIVARYPSYLTRFRPGEVYEINMPLCMDEDADALLEACSQLRGLKSLDTRQMSPTKKSIPFIDKFESLQILQIVIDSDLAASLARLSIIKNLSELRLIGEADVAPILYTMRNSTHLHRLRLNTPYLGNESLTYIASLPQLELFELSGKMLRDPNWTNRCLAILSRAPKLEQMELWGLGINADTIKILRSFKTLKRLKVDVDAKAGSSKDELIRQLQTALPNIPVFRLSAPFDIKAVQQ